MWQANFYQQYMQQHAAMTQWIMQLHRNIDHQHSNHNNQIPHSEPHCHQRVHYQQACPAVHTCHHRHHSNCCNQIQHSEPCCHQSAYYQPTGPAIQAHYQHSNYSNQVQHSEPCYNPSAYYQQAYPAAQVHHQNLPTASATTCSDITLEQEEYYESYENDVEDDDASCEYELNVDAILAMRAAKEELNKLATEDTKSNKSSVGHQDSKPVNHQDSSESESFVFVESEKEEFDFVELGSLRDLDSKKKQVGICRNLGEELKIEKQLMEYRYGEKAAAIAHLEAVETERFNNIYDLYQPPLWPVLPVRL